MQCFRVPAGPPVYEQAELKRQLFGARSDPLTPEEEGQLAEVAADLQELAHLDPPVSAAALADEAEQKPAPIWAELQQQALALQPHWLPQSSLAKAVNYLRNEYAALIGYLQSPAYAVDNNLVENSIRGPAVGRRRWLFIGHPDAGWRSAVIYSFIVSCRRRGINLQEYLTDILQRLPSMNITQIGGLLPEHWRPRPASTD